MYGVPERYIRTVMATIASEDRSKRVESTTREDVIVALWLRRQRSE